MSTAVIEKAQRLLSTGRVTEVQPPTRRFSVVGDHGTYSVDLNQDGSITCPCPASQPDCAHVTAVLLQLRDEGNR